jgi:hypothetical protein
LNQLAELDEDFKDEDFKQEMGHDADRAEIATFDVRLSDYREA